MLYATRPLGYLLLLSVLFELAEQGIDRLVGDGDGKITLFKLRFCFGISKH
jgi:hypothetical protein